MINTSLLQSGAVMRVSLILSFFFHVVAILVLQEAFPLQWPVEDLRTFRVDLIRPPVEDMDPEELSAPDISRTEQEAKPPPSLDQDTISLDTKDERYVTYAKLIKERIGFHWKYPPDALERLLEGKLMVVFSLARKGEVIQVKLMKNSGHEILDREAIRAIKAAAPFPPFPGHVRVSRLNIKASFDYRLTSKKKNK
ncbi:MAG: energy transducer TonB [Desulfobacteraceae bacterium]